MHETHVLDLNFRGETNLITVFLVRNGTSNVLIDTGPESCAEALADSLKEHGLGFGDLDWVLPTHIHLDHAGGAWKVCERGPDVVFHPEGARHMIQPRRLYESAKRIYGERMDSLWGKLGEIDERKVVVAEDGKGIEVGATLFTPVFTPGHAKHHVAWMVGDDCFAGDVCGCKILDGPCEMPVPPPDLDFEAWEASLDKIEAAKPERIFLTHSGVRESAARHLNEAREALAEIRRRSAAVAGSGNEIDESALERMIDELRKEKMVETGAAENPSLVKKYSLINPNFMSAKGLKRYWSLKSV